jgi:hypothetical protein
MTKPGGKLIVAYKVGAQITTDIFEKKLWWIGRGTYEILEHTQVGSRAQVTLKKTKRMDVNIGSMKEWSFGIVTNGDRDDWIEEIIQSIYSLKIPTFEIIICGKYRTRDEKNIRYIPFSKRAKRGWINRKKNLIAEQAKFENMCIIHDRILFEKSWYRGMKQYGNSFAILGCEQIEKATGEHAGDWLTLGGPDGTRWKISRLVEKDWDYFGFIGGQLVIIKRSIWAKVLWDETRYWDGVDDADWDIIFRARDLGYITRFNPAAKTKAITWRHGKLPLKYSFSEGLFPKDMIARRIMRTAARAFHAVPVLNLLLHKSGGYIIRTKIYRRLIYH